MKKILFSVFLLTFCTQFNELAAATKACPEINSDKEDVELTCRDEGCLWQLGACTYCPDGTYGSNGCLSCANATHGSVTGYWTHSDSINTQQGVEACYALCHEHVPDTKIENGYVMQTSQREYFGDYCGYTVGCNTGYYRERDNITTYKCYDCSSLENDFAALQSEGYWNGGAGDDRGREYCTAECGATELTTVTGAATYKSDTVRYPAKCEPASCINSSDYCSSNNRTPNGYHLRTSTTNGKSVSTCHPNWQAYTGNYGDTGFQYWDSGLSDWSTGYITTCGANRHFKPQSGGLSTTPKCNKKYGTCESDIQTCNADFLGGCYVEFPNANGTDVTAVQGSIFTTGQLKWAGGDTTDKWTVSSGECKCKVESVPIMERKTKPIRNVKVGEKTVVLSYTGNGRKGAANDTLWGDAVTTVTSCAKGYYKPDDQNTCVKTEPGYYSDSDTTTTQTQCPVTHPHSAAGAKAKSDCYEDCNETAAAKTAEWKKKNTGGRYGNYFGGAYVSLTGGSQYSPDKCSFELTCIHDDESCGSVSDTGDTKYGYHHSGDKCLPYRKPCSGGGVKNGWQMLNSAGTKYGECMALECDADHHIIDIATNCSNAVRFDSGTCIANVQSCASVTDTGGKTNKDSKGNVTPVLSACHDSFGKSGTITGNTKGYSGLGSQGDYDWSTCACTVSGATQVDDANKPIGGGTLTFTGCQSDHKTWLNQSWDMSSCAKGYYRPENSNTCTKTAKGYYSDSDTSMTQEKCPAGSTSDAGSTDIKQCYMKGGKDGTLFCDKHGCFNLPTGVQIFYAGD